MAVYYKFKSAKDYDSIAIDGHFISVANLKEKIFESKHLGRGTDFDLVVTNAQTNEEYLDEAMLIPKNTSVLIRRVPGRPRMTIVTEPVIEQDEPILDTNKSDDGQAAKSSFVGADSSLMHYPEDSEWDEFGNDLYAIPEVLPMQASNPIQDASPPSKADEESLIKALIDTPALDWQRQTSDGFGPGRGFGRGMGGRMMGGRGFGRGGLERKMPPQGYICHRCKVPGHFIQHCPTNGDPNYDIKRVKPPTGIPRSMLMATPDGSYALPSGDVAVLKPNEAAFEKEIEGMPSTRSVGDLPPELHCPLCKDVMKDAVLTSKCCFKSFCDKCIRDYIISKSICVCGATNILADDLLPNKTLRDAINRILDSNNSSAENAGSACQVQDMESKIPQLEMEPRVPSPSLSATSKGEQVPTAKSEEIFKVKESTDEGKAVSAPFKSSEKGKMGKVPDASEATHDSISVKEPASQGSAPLADEDVQQRPVSGEAGKKKKKKKARLPMNGLPANAADMQWKFPQDNLAADNYNMMPLGPSPYNPFWSGMQPGMEYAAPYGGSLPYMGYGLGPYDLPFGVLPQDPFGAQGFMMPPVPPHRDLADFGMGVNAGPPVMSREEFEGRKADLQRKREIERRGESREFSKDREFSWEVSSSADFSSLKSKSKSASIPAQASSGEHHRRRHRSERSSPELVARDSEIPRPSSKRKSDYNYDREYDNYHHRHSHNHRSESSAGRSSLEPPSPQPKSTTTTAPTLSKSASAAADRKQKPSVFSRISFPAEESSSKKRKLPSSLSDALVASSSGHHSHSGRTTANGYHEDYTKTTSSSRTSAAAAEVDYESSEEDERHFKRRPSRYKEEAEAEAEAEAEETPRHSRGLRDRNHGGYSTKHHR
ncbi:E3 ubiquitin ligase PARAQUAT TOLERANCE 3-like isoform X1 [Rhododendron vialii]|uniref:E3 ubiquitin ligase PARAQUAT TOLERANCE 3-like isoform X1 n=2 Tax=Rhododendron vialii TaxID=182163 RepID=UPI00265DF0B3|nr:E3 ubiquitin ligase PARAQUAT TOLERANCE 3-like isoform X1 [Rhododendron vialii]